ncbi:hypothetical protein BN973_01605 [Mycobacterium triplex]|uniref:Uncharacterized protein n=1 Tax=Mycobacterium triplex TaxID=47839 RepID=A0A024JVL5_9MYCO|nr:hypothetical protein BN973_01605 [Mycobacterium triplex]
MISTASSVEQNAISVGRCASSATTPIHEIAPAKTARAATVAKKNTVPYAHMCVHWPHDWAAMDSAPAAALSRALPSNMPRTPNSWWIFRHSAEPMTTPTVDRNTSTRKLPLWCAVRRA